MRVQVLGIPRSAGQNPVAVLLMNHRPDWLPLLLDRHGDEDTEVWFFVEVGHRSPSA
jgi:hypothetical protein